jgi:hypothetical protein
VRVLLASCPCSVWAPNASIMHLGTSASQGKCTRSTRWDGRAAESVCHGGGEWPRHVSDGVIECVFCMVVLRCGVNAGMELDPESMHATGGCGLFPRLLGKARTSTPAAVNHIEPSHQYQAPESLPSTNSHPVSTATMVCICSPSDPSRDN